MELHHEQFFNGAVLNIIGGNEGMFEIIKQQIKNEKLNKWL